MKKQNISLPDFEDALQENLNPNQDLGQGVERTTRVAEIQAQVQAGTYRVESLAVARAILKRLL